MARPADVDTDGEDTSTATRLGEAGFAPVWDDRREGTPAIPGWQVIGDLGTLDERPRFGAVPKEEQGFTQTRRAALASLSSTDDPALAGPAADAPVRCLDCPVLASVSGVRGTFTTASLRNLPGIREDRRLRRLLGEGPGALMAARPE